MITRRSALLGLSGLAVAASATNLEASTPTVVVWKDPNCDCCSGWITHLRRAGFVADAQNVADINRVKARLGVPSDLAACHTAEVAGYVIEGHVPAPAIRRLLAEKPNAKGLAVAGMPAGSPGMEVPGTPPDEYNVILFGEQRRIFARFRGSIELDLGN